MSTYQLAQIVVYVKNVAVSSSFYEKELSLKKIESYDGMAWFNINNEAKPILMLHETTNVVSCHPKITLEFTTPELDSIAAAKSVSQLGKVVQMPIKQEWGVREMIIEDPDGHQLYFTQPID